MKQKLKLYDLLFLLAGASMVIALLWYLSNPELAPYLFSIGAALLVFIRLKQPYKGDDFRVKRLEKMQQFATVLYVVVAYFMFKQSPYWQAFFVISAVLEVVVAFRLPKEQ